MATENLSEEDKDFLAKIEEELKHRYTEKDEEFMKVFNLKPSVPPIMENWYPPSPRRNNSRRYNPNDHNNRDRGYRGRDSGYHGNRSSGQGSYSDNRFGHDYYEDSRHGGRYNRHRY